MDRLKTMREMASGIAHELNQPLTVIVTRAEVADRGCERGLLTITPFEDPRRAT